MCLLVELDEDFVKHMIYEHNIYVYREKLVWRTEGPVGVNAQR